MDFTFDELTGFVIDNMKKLFWPEEWIKLDMTFSKAELFAILLVDRQGEVIMSQLADYTGIPMSTATGIIDRLVKNGYLKRERSEADRRIVALKLSDKGKAYTVQFKALVSNYFGRVLNELEDEEKALLQKVFLKVISAMAEEKGLQDVVREDRSKIKRIEIE